MRRLCCSLVFLALSALLVTADDTARPFRVLAFYSTHAEADHVEFAEQAVRFYAEVASRRHFTLESSTNWDDLTPQRLKGVDVVLFFNETPHAPAQRTAFENYMESGGGWIGFHAAGYNDAGTGWPWFVRFLGGAIFQGPADTPSSGAFRFA